jgi:hypothetical protein
MQIITFQNGLDTDQVIEAVPMHISNRYFLFFVLKTLLVYLSVTQITPLTFYYCILHVWRKYPKTCN